MNESRSQFSDQMELKSKFKKETHKNNKQTSTFGTVGRDYFLYEQRFYRWTDAPEPNKYNLERSENLRTNLAKLVLFKKIHDHPAMQAQKIQPKCIVGEQ